MPAQQTEWTADMARALPDDGKRYEVLDGELFVSPSPRLNHQAVVSELVFRLRQYVRAHELGWVHFARADRTRKRRVYQDERIPEYWIVDPDGRVLD